MGVDYALFERLVEPASQPDIRPGRGLMPGQGVHHQSRWRRRFRIALVNAGMDGEAAAAPGGFPIESPDVAKTGRRLRLSRPFPAGRVYLYFEMRKTASAKLARAAWRSDYKARWRKSAAEPAMMEA
ncbi:MAG: hypothetical protein WD969_04685 [Paracoccaceae bacterium]